MTKKSYIDPNADILPPTDDCIFKSLLTRDEPESKIILMDIISNIIGCKVISVTILNNEIPTTDITQLQERLDVNCKIDNGDFINLEMQATKMPSSLPSTIQSLINRMTYYLCDLYSSQGIKGKSYDKLEKAYQITLTDFTVFKHRKEFTNHFQFRNENCEVLTADVNIIFLELSKLGDILKKPVSEMSPLEMWLVFFEYVDDKEKREIVNQIIDVKEEIGMAGEILQTISKDDHECAKFRSRRKFANDRESDLNASRDAGMKVGMKAGMKAGMEKVIIAALREGASIEFIEKITGFDKRLIEEIKNISK